MKLTAVFVMLFTVSGVVAQNDPQSVPKRYLPFQGEWRVVAMEDHETKSSCVAEIFVKVTGRKFELSGAGVSDSTLNSFEFGIPKNKSDNPYRSLREHGAKALDDIVDVENQIVVFWFSGIFKLTDDELQLALTYCGQGVHGAHFKNLRPASSFDQKPIDGEIRIVLERRKNQANRPDSGN